MPEANLAQFVKSLGAEAAFDYNDPDCGSKIREHTEDSLKLVFDCISEGASPEIDCAAISSKGGRITYLLSAQHSREDVENTVSFRWISLLSTPELTIY